MRGDWSGLLEMVDLKETLQGEGEVDERQRRERDEAWVGTLALLGNKENKDRTFG